MISKIGTVIRREYLERVRSKAFIIGTILGPILMGLIMVLPVLIMGKGGDLLRVAVLDASGDLQSQVEESLREARRDDEPRFDVRPSGELRIHVGRDLDGLFARYREAGVAIVFAPISQPWGLREFAIREINGHTLRFCAEA